MSNIMSMKEVKNKVHRNGFDLTSRIGFTAKVGEILPVRWQMVYPGESYKLTQASFTRTSPVNTAAYTRVKEFTDTFFVPIRLLWDKFPQWVIQTKQPQFASSLLLGAQTTGQQPYITDADLVSYMANLLELNYGNNARDINGQHVFQQAYKLLDCLGYSSILKSNMIFSDESQELPDGFNSISSPTALNIFPLLAYQKIYSDFFRYQQWEGSKPYTFNLDFVLNASQSHLGLNVYNKQGSNSYTFYNDTIFELHYANYYKDYVMGQLPSSQFGDVAIAGPVLGNLGVSFPSVTGSTAQPIVARASSGVSGGIGVNSSSPVPGQFFNLSSTNNTSGISVLAIRQAQALQKWKEVTQAAGFDYKSQLKGHWNVNVSDLQSDKCIRVGGFDSQVTISEVINQALTPDNPANIAGKGIGSSYKKFTFKNNTNEYGILMTVYHSVPLLDYTQDTFLPRDLLKVSPTDYAIPEFDSIGMQETYASEIFNDYHSSKMDLQPLGYAPRYAEYKTARDVVRGAFAGGGYKDWVAPLDRAFLQSRIFSDGSATGFDYRSFKISPTLLNSIFLAQVRQVPDNYKPGESGVGKYVPSISFDDDQLIINFLDQCYAVRLFSRTGLPY